jgi:hypothetical protein
MADTNGNGVTAAHTTPVGDPLEEAVRIIEAAASSGLALKATGGVAIALICPSAQRPPLQRSYQDIDFVARSGHADEITSFFAELGYQPEEEFNVLHGRRRLFFLDQDHQRQADVFLDGIEMCHRLDLRDRLDVLPRTLSAADLLLSKLQVVETNQKDYTDTIAILSDHELTQDDSGIGMGRISKVCSSDWGWWRTVTMVAERTREFAELAESSHGTDHTQAVARIDQLARALDEVPKSRRWKMRARVGDRIRWHEEPEDIDHEP